MCLLQRTECEERQPLVVQEWADMKLKDAVGEKRPKPTFRLEVYVL